MEAPDRSCVLRRLTVRFPFRDPETAESPARRPPARTILPGVRWKIPIRREAPGGEDARRDTGRSGERDAETVLRRAGMRVLRRRWRCRAGEIDLIAEDRGVVVFVEVKTRTGTGFGEPWEAVGPAKRQRLARAAAAFLQSAATDREEPLCRFDVVEVIVGVSGPPRVRHWRDAFRIWRSG